MRWLTTIPKAPRLMVLQSVTIPGGRAPEEPLTANVTVTVYEWLRGPGMAAGAGPGGGPAGGPGGGGAPGGGGGPTGGAGPRRTFGGV